MAQKNEAFPFGTLGSKICENLTFKYLANYECPLVWGNPIYLHTLSDDSAFKSILKTPKLGVNLNACLINTQIRKLADTLFNVVKSSDAISCLYLK